MAQEVDLDDVFSGRKTRKRLIPRTRAAVTSPWDTGDVVVAAPAEFDGRTLALCALSTAAVAGAWVGAATIVPGSEEVWEHAVAAAIVAGTGAGAWFAQPGPVTALGGAAVVVLAWPGSLPVVVPLAIVAVTIHTFSRRSS